ncbi:MAG TPA: PDZ domain-containing protein [Candidatus Limnocylindrales bacterium]|nr:PDZ domain-containing protein [Candidatus Limnocylindrales bacterium]
MRTSLFLILGIGLSGLGTLTAQTNGASPCGVDARMMRYPDVSATQIVFVYAGDIWVAPRTGGPAMRLSSPKGEESFPRFSPDGSQIAFSGNYDGNTDIYVVPSAGGLPKRLTYHGDPDRMLEWYPDGQSLLFATSRTSEKDRFNQLYKISAKGGLPEKLPVPYGEFGAISPDGKTLAYIPISVDFRTWKRYRGGMNSAIWLFDLGTYAAKDITGNDSANSQPMWHGSTLYFLSDRDARKRANIWAFDTKNNKFRQITRFEEFDTHFPNIGPNDIVFENGGRLYLMDLATEKYSEVHIQVLTDRATLKAHLEDVSKAVHEPTISPSAKRAAFEARGEIFTVPAEHGVVRNLTRSSGIAERYPAWSPDGKSIAYFSDRSGEYELTVRSADGSGEEEVLTKLGPGFRYRPYWSPDSRKIAFVDQAMRIHLYDLDKKETRQIGKQLWLYHDGLSHLKFSWSKDSRWLAYAQDQENQHTAIALYDTKEDKLRVVTSGYYDDDEPVFDPEGKYLFYRSGRDFSPIYSDLDNTWIYANTYQLVAVPLRHDVASPLAPRNDDEGEKKEKDKDKDKSSSKEKDKKPSDEKDKKKDEPKLVAKNDDKEEAKDESKPDKKETDTEEKEEKEKPVKPVEIEWADFESRAVVLPPKPGDFRDLAAVKGKLVYRRPPRTGSADEKSTLVYYDFEKREDKTILEDVDDAILAAKESKLLVRRKDDYAIIEVKEGQKFEKKLPIRSLETVIDPVAEWEQLFTEAWRLQRDYFYDPNMHGVDWAAMRTRYDAILKDAVTRWDVNYVLGELIGELSSSHTYRSGGDVEDSKKRGVGYLGVDFTLENGAYRIKHIVEGAPWDAEIRSPLKQPGVDVKEGDYLLTVNSLPLDTTEEPYAAFQGLADQPVFITVNNEPKLEGAREILVQTLTNESRLRHLAWIEKNRKQVDEASNGRIGYVYVPDTGRHGQSELVRQFRAQYNKEGLVIDERFNSGGQIPDRFVEMLGRKPLNYWGVRDGEDWTWPQVSNGGPKAMLINGWSGSGGDCFPFYFQKAKLGPLIGTRTWGGLIGITGTPPLVDGGSVTVPTFGIYSTKGEWIIEGHGVDPDIAVVDDPSLMAKGHDPQLERAVDEVLKALQKNPPEKITKPKYPLRAG